MLTTQTTVTCHKQICYKLIFRLSGCETHLSSKCIKISNGKIYIGHYNTQCQWYLVYKWDVCLLTKYSHLLNILLVYRIIFAKNISTNFNTLIDCRYGGLIYIYVLNLSSMLCSTTLTVHLSHYDGRQIRSNRNVE